MDYINNQLIISDVCCSKIQPDLVDGPKHLFAETQSIKKYCPPLHHDLLMKTVMRNAYFSHPHCVLVAMLGNTVISLFTVHRVFPKIPFFILNTY